jgi:quinolinate synthase
MLLWDGACHVHKEFSLEHILKLKDENPEAKVISHPECEKQILDVSDFVGSTSGILKYSQENSATTFIVATESGILHQMKKANPNKVYIPAPPNNIDGLACACNDCEYMKLNNLKKIYLALKNEQPEILMDEEIRVKAEIPIKRMLEISAKHNL